MRMLVAGGGFEPLSGIDNIEDADSTMGEMGEMGTMGSVTVQIQYKLRYGMDLMSSEAFPRAPRSKRQATNPRYPSCG